LPWTIATEMKALAAAGLLAAALMGNGCTTVWIRGIVQDRSGESISGASVRLLEAGEEKPVATRTADRNGCFMVEPFAPRGEHRFTLEITAPGFKPATYEFELQTPVFYAALAPSPSDAQSEIRLADLSEREDTWMPLCIETAPLGAAQLSP
jgi:hypothetical protein